MGDQAEEQAQQKDPSRRNRRARTQLGSTNRQPPCWVWLPPVPPPLRYSPASSSAGKRRSSSEWLGWPSDCESFVLAYMNKAIAWPAAADSE